jgi:hypothetical protein
MREIFRHRIFVIIGLLAVAIFTLSYVTLQKQPSGCINTEQCSNPLLPAKSEVLWDAFSRQFMSAVLFQ